MTVENPSSWFSLDPLSLYQESVPSQTSRCLRVMNTSWLLSQWSSVAFKGWPEAAEEGARAIGHSQRLSKRKLVAPIGPYALSIPEAPQSSPGLANLPPVKGHLTVHRALSPSVLVFQIPSLQNACRSASLQSPFLFGATFLSSC